MPNRALQDPLRAFALEAAALLSADVEAGAELEFELEEKGAVLARSPVGLRSAPGGRRGPALYHYHPLTERFIAERWERLRVLPTFLPAAAALGAGATRFLRASGLHGDAAEPALQAMLERLYEDASGFSFPEERFDRLVAEVDRTLSAGAIDATVAAALPGVELDVGVVELGDGLTLARGDEADAPAEALWDENGEDPRAVAVLRREADGELPLGEARERFRSLVAAMRVFKPGGVTLSALGWARAGEGRWQPVELEPAGRAHGDPWVLLEGEEGALADFVQTLGRSAIRGRVAWALTRFDLGCGRRHEAEGLSDHLLALVALLDSDSEADRGRLPLRVAALCAEEGERRGLQRRIEQAFELEAFLMAGGRGQQPAGESPRTLAAELEGHVRALLRDVLCGYLDADLRAVADDILLESAAPIEIAARDLREDPDFGPDSEPPAEVDLELEQAQATGRFSRSPEPEGVTPSADWQDFSAPV